MLNRLSTGLRSRVLDWLFEGRMGMLDKPMYLDAAEAQTQGMITLSRRYYDGDHVIYMTDRQQKWLDQHNPTAGTKLRFRVNCCSDVVDSIVERLKITAFASAEQQKTVERLAWGWWKANAMEVVSQEAHKYVARDGEAFILIDFDEETNVPRFILHPRWVERGPALTRASGTWTDPWAGYGMRMAYPFGDYLSKPTKAIKRWYDEIGGNVVERMTVYWPDRVERFFRAGAGWEPLE